jgi:nucleoside-diphosphate-sugar epimerase
MIGVVGSTRFIGRFVVQVLLDAGESVTWLVRDPERARKLVGEGVQIRQCDLLRLPDDLPPMTCIVNAAHISFARQVLELCEKVKSDRAIFISSTWVHSRFITEQVQSTLDGEEIVKASGLAWTILRPTMIYGPGDRNISVIRDQIARSRVFPVVGSGNGLVQPVYVEDVALAISSAASRRSAEMACFEICGPDEMTYSQMIDSVAASLGKSPVKIYVPISVARSIAWVQEKWSSRPRITADHIRRMTEDRAFSIEEAEAFLGFFPRSFAKGLDQAVAR